MKSRVLIQKKRAPSSEDAIRSPRSWLEVGNAFLDVAQPMHCPAAVKLFDQGFPAHEVYFIEEGLVKLTFLDGEGYELIIGLRTPGWILGAASTIIPKPHPVSATTVIECKLRRVPAQVFLDRLGDNAELSRYIQQMQSREIYEQINQAVQLGCLSAQSRLEQLLYQLISVLGPDRIGNEMRFELPLKDREIAELIAVTPEYLSLMLKRMNKNGLLRRERGCIIISDFDSLFHLADF